VIGLSGEGDADVSLVGFCSQLRAREAYIHFVGVHPRQRGRRLGRRLTKATLRRRQQFTAS